MGISEIYIVKRDGKRAPFSLEKIKRAISKAFLSVGGYATDDDLTSVLSRVHISDGMNVEEIQNQVEVALMAERYFAVAKSYMLYRQKHTEDREDREKLEFLINYCDASNPATGSKYDANANVENKNIATLIGELPKQNFIRLNRRLLTDRIKEMYGKELSDKYLRLLAEYDNFRRRSARERENIYADVRCETLKKFLPVYDSLSRALEQTPDDDPARKGIEGIMNQYHTALNQLGVSEIEAVGKPFDANRHNAVMHIEDDAYGEGVVVEEFEKGFCIGDRVLRYSVVKVAN